MLVVAPPHLVARISGGPKRKNVRSNISVHRVTGGGRWTEAKWRAVTHLKILAAQETLNLGESSAERGR